jgi:uncharacterized protein GlcG (DUF336 family)
MMAAAEAEAVKNNWPMAIVILDSTGVMLHRLDNTQYGSISVAEDKAHTALDFRRLTSWRAWFWMRSRISFDTPALPAKGPNSLREGLSLKAGILG